MKTVRLVVFVFIFPSFSFQLDSQLETIGKFFLPSQSLWICSLPPLLEDLGGWKEKGILGFNNHKVTERRKKGYKDGGIVVWGEEMREEGLRIRGGPKEDWGFEGVGYEIPGGGH